MDIDTLDLEDFDINDLSLNESIEDILKLI